MPFIPHTEQDVREMLEVINVPTLSALFEEIPESLRIAALPEAIPSGVGEMALAREMRECASQDVVDLCFIGAGAYEHHIPAAVWDIVSRGEFMTAYTPYQAEASQGTLQLLYEYQTMMASLTGMEVSNASLYDGATALAEAVLMAVRIRQSSGARQVLVPKTVHPYYRATLRTIVQHQSIDIIELPFDIATGCLDVAALENVNTDNVAALVIPQPNFLGVLENVDVLTKWAEARGILTIAQVNPTAIALLKEPGQWGEKGVDIVCGEGQPLGVPLASGGPYFGFLCCKMAWVRQLPGRIVGRTVDVDGKPGFTLTLQAREQHIRRAKATSNICTNQGLLVAAATIYLSLMGPFGLRRVAETSHVNARQLVEKLNAISGVQILFKKPFFHEIVLRLDKPVAQVLQQLGAMGIQGGFDLTIDYPELGECMLVCVTETKTVGDLSRYCDALVKCLSQEKMTKGASAIC